MCIRDSLYTNIPVRETLQVLRNNLFESNKLNAQMIEQLMSLLEVILGQNYFTFDDQFYSQRDDLAMGSPLSGLLADIYLNFYENTFMFSNNIRVKADDSDPLHQADDPVCILFLQRNKCTC